MTDDLVQRLRRTYRKEYAPTGSMVGDISNRLRPFPILATELLFNPDGREAADRIEAQAAEIERLKNQLSVETEPSPYCPICGSCGEEGCCGSKRCMYPDAGIEADRNKAADRIEALRLAVVHYDAALKSSWPYGAKGDAWEHWNEARITLQEVGEPFTRSSDT